MASTRFARAAGHLVPVAAGLLLAVTGNGAEPPAPAPVRDLYYGDTLFHFYKDDHFTALTNLLVARSDGRVPHHEAESELLLGGLYLHYGQHRRAEQIFTDLLESQATPAVRDRAWFYLGKLRYQRGFFTEALQAFAKVQGELPPELAVQRPLLVAQSQMALGDFDSAARLLDGWEGPESWAAYARYNLGVSLVRLGRLEEGARQLDRVGRAVTRTSERANLKDKANLALGYAYLQKSLDGEAQPVLERVRLEGPFSSKALLGLGWAMAAQGRYDEALTPWLELRDRDLLDSAVQESLLAIPYAYGHLADHEQAATEYQAALTDFDTEIGRLDAAIASAKAGELIPAVLKSDDADIGRWFWELDSVPDSTPSRYLYHLIADHQFQEGLRNVRDLRSLERHLDQWAEKLVAFDDMVANRQEAYRRRDPAFSSAMAAVDIDRISARRDAVAARLAAIESHRDVAGPGNAEELDRWSRLAALEQDASFATAAPDLRERQRLLKGVMLWDLDREYQVRLWQQRRALKELDALVAESGESELSATGARRDIPGTLAGFSARIAAARPRIDALRSALREVRASQEGELQAAAVEALTDQRERLSAYRVQAQFALATIYDRAATAARAAPAAGRDGENSQ